MAAPTIRDKVNSSENLKRSVFLFIIIFLFSLMLGYLSNFLMFIMIPIFISLGTSLFFYFKLKDEKLLLLLISVPIIIILDYFIVLEEFTKFYYIIIVALYFEIIFYLLKIKTNLIWFSLNFVGVILSVLTLLFTFKYWMNSDDFTTFLAFIFCFSPLILISTFASYFILKKNSISNN